MSILRTWWTRHKTKSLGLIMVVVGAVQSNINQIQQYIPAKDYGFIIAGLGILVAALGFLNSRQNHDGA